MPVVGETVAVPLAPRTRWRAAPGCERALLTQVAGGSWQLIQQHPDRGAYRVETDGATYFVKHYRPTGVAGCLRDFVFRRKPQRAHHLSGQLLEAGVATPAVLGLFAALRGPLYEAVLVAEWVPGAEIWARYLQQHLDRNGAAVARRDALGKLAELLGCLHRLGFYHGDLAGNLLLAGEAETCSPYLIDLEELQPRLTWKRRVKNLEEMARGILDLGQVSLRQRWEFLCHYGRVAGLDRTQCRRLWREGRAAQLRRIERARASARRGGAP